MTTIPQPGVSPDEIIETAIVIKNIPFAYAEEDFRQKLFPQLGLVPPYAFNYHRNKVDGAFCGLAFANFQEASDAQKAVDVLNNYELERRWLCVELKKKLPAEEEKRRRLARRLTRNQTTATEGLGAASVGNELPIPGTQVELGLDSTELSRVDLDPAIRPRMLYEHPHSTRPTGTHCIIHSDNIELDMNDPVTLGFYTSMQIFLSNQKAAGLEFPRTLTQQQRSIVHTLAARLDLNHASHGLDPALYICVTRRNPPPTSAPPTEH
jgi:RNA recognition motif-containing protein